MTVAEARQSKPRQPGLRRSTGTGIAWRVGCTTAGSAAGGKTRGPCTGGAGTWVASSGLESAGMDSITRSEEHTSELQSHLNLVCRLLLEKKKNIVHTTTRHVDTGMWHR